MDACELRGLCLDNITQKELLGGIALALANDATSRAGNGNMLVESGTDYTIVSGPGEAKTGAVIEVIGTADLVIDAMTPVAGWADLSGETLVKGKVYWSRFTGLSITSGKAVVHFLARP